MFKSKSATVLHEFKPKTYPTDASQYELLEECGAGVTSTVHRARCIPLDEVVAIKRCNLDLSDAELQVVIAEVAIMRRYQHPAVLPLLCSFVSDSELWLVMPYMEGGSVVHVMRYAHPEGLEEPIIATIAKEVLRALEYLHKQGAIHRDVKAGNVLLAGDGTVRLGDFGVSATMERAGSWGHDLLGRRTLVGTPCWMAPEVMEESAYNDRADIWSFGITLLEMAHGSAPFAKLPPLKILMMTLQNPPPQLEDRVGQRTFSKSMREVVAMCLQKESLKRPSAKQLLEHRFFRQHTRDKTYIVKHLLAGLPPLTERVRHLRAGFGGRVPTQQAHNREMRSRVSYMSGVLNWDFHLPAAHTAGQDSSCGGSTHSATSTGAGGEQSSATSRPGASGSNGMPAASTAPPSPSPPPPLQLPLPEKDIIATPSQQPPLPASTPVSPPYLTINPLPAASAPPTVLRPPPRSLATSMPSSPPQTLVVEQQVPHAPKLAGSLVESAFSDAAKNASAATPAAPEVGGAAAAGVPVANIPMQYGAGADAADAGPPPDRLFRRASLRGSVSVPDFKQKQVNQTRPSGTTESSQEPERQAAQTQTQGESAVAEGTFRGRPGTTGGGGGGRGGGGGLRVSFAPDVLNGGRAGTAAASPSGVVLRKGRFQVYESIQPVPRPATAPLPSAVKKPTTAAIPTSTRAASSQPPSIPLPSAAASPAHPERKVIGHVLSKPLQAPSGQPVSTVPAPLTAASTRSAPPDQVRKAVEPAALLCAAQLALPSPAARFSALYDKWCDMALRSLLADVCDPESALQLALVLMAAPPPQHVPNLRATELLSPESLSERSPARRSPPPSAAQPAALPILEHPVPRRATLAMAESLVPSFQLPPPPPPPPSGGMLPQAQPISQIAGRGDGRNSGRVTSPSHQEIPAQPPQPPAPRSRSSSAPHRLLVPTLYPPLGLNGDDLSESDTESGSDGVVSPGEGSGSGASIGSGSVGGASIGGGGGSGGGKLVVVEVDESHPQYVGLAELYGDRRGAGWALSAGLLQPLSQAMPQEIERDAREVPLPARPPARAQPAPAVPPAPASPASGPPASGADRVAGGRELEHRRTTEVWFRSDEGPDVNRTGQPHHEGLARCHVPDGVGVGGGGGEGGPHCCDTATTLPESDRLVSAPGMTGEAPQLQWGPPTPPTPPHAPRLPLNRGLNQVATQTKRSTTGLFFRRDSPSGLLKAGQHGSGDSGSGGSSSGGSSSNGSRNSPHGGRNGASNSKTDEDGDSTGSSDKDSSSDVDRAIASLLKRVHVSPVGRGDVGREASLNVWNIGRDAAAPAPELHPHPEVVLQAAVATNAAGTSAHADGFPSCTPPGSPTALALQSADVAPVAAARTCPMDPTEGAGATGVNYSTAGKAATLVHAGNDVAYVGNADATRTGPMLVSSEVVMLAGPAVGGAVPPEVQQQQAPAMQLAFASSSCQASSAANPNLTRNAASAGRGVARGRFVVLSEQA